ncbi:MAG: phage Gp37/Gp68 family protein [Gammaproteobacteria bacterium]|nr:phage Gp37/Gp68 family protein [Gammaproteobacteria bacterium]
MTSKIEWTEHTWNPVIGCTKVSAGCKYCYAETMAVRLQAMGSPDYVDGFRVVKMLPHKLDIPLRRKKPTTYFVNSMSDLFHPDVTVEFIGKVFDVMRETPQHQYQILTKRAERMREVLVNIDVPKNAWLGVTVENRKDGIPRIRELAKIKSFVKFLSVEPLLEDLGAINLAKIDWVIVGGESGSKARPMEKAWALAVKKQCRKQKVKFFFKQWGAWGEDGAKRAKHLNGRNLSGRTWDEIPLIAV